MTRIIQAFLLTVAALLPLSTMASDVDELTALVEDFLASSHKEIAHRNFWAEDLVYTSSAGLRFGKADIMAGFETSDGGAGEEDLEVIYSGEEIDVRLYGDTAIVAFKLVGRPTDTAAGAEVLYYFNTGTFLKRDGVWRAVAWQATKIPPQ